jgi:NADPH-dependent curcumin reductase CurA
MTITMSREIHLRSRPVGLPSVDDFELVEVSVPQPDEGEVLVRNIFMSVDPYMRGRMVDRKSYAPPFQLNQVLYGGCVGQVVQSNRADLPVGQYVRGMQGWREYFISDGRGIRAIEADAAPIQAHLGVLGMPGQTAYFGLLDIGQLKAGQTVFVSGAAGAVGSVACQIAKIKGCRVIASAGSEAKVAHLGNELGVDAAFNYKVVDNLKRTLGQLAPDGIDVYFDNVGGDHLEAAITIMNDYGRIVACGMISQYNATQPACAPGNLASIVSKRLTIKGFIVTDFRKRFGEFYDDMGQ